MKNKTLISLVGIFAMVFSINVLPAHAQKSQIVDFCANKYSGKVRPIAKGVCSKNERSLGVLPITRPKKRPTELVPQFLSRYQAAKAAAKLKGHTLAITSGYRSLAHQEVLYKRAIARHGSAAAASKWVLPPKKSNHPWGIAIDINYGVSGAKGKKAATWLEKNGYKYGLCRRYQNEWWHFEPLVAPGQKCPKMEPYPS